MNMESSLTLDRLFDGRLTLLQSKKGYRLSIDAVLLGMFAREKASGSTAELGTGNGAVSLILAKHDRIGHITGIDIQKELVDLARRNAALNGVSDKIEIIQADIKSLHNRFKPESFSCVVTNPPFYSKHSGRINPDPENAIARHELHGDLNDFVSAARFLLKFSGHFFIIYLATRLTDLFTAMRQHNIEPKTARFIHPKNTREATMVFVQGKKGAKPGLKIKAPVFIHEPSGEYSAYVKKIFEAV